MIRVLSTLAVKGAMQDLAALFLSQTGVGIDIDYAPTVGLLPRLHGGEHADIGILTAQGIDDMIAAGIMRPGSRVDAARSYVGVAVKAGSPKPDIRSVEAFKAAILAARAVCYSKIGASGIYFAGLIERMGIADQVNARAVVAATGFTAERLVSGEADLAIQQISELLVIPGIEVIGRLPAEIGTTAIFSAGVMTVSKQPEQATAFTRFLASPEAAPVLRRSGLEPA